MHVEIFKKLHNFPWELEQLRFTKPVTVLYLSWKSTHVLGKFHEVFETQVQPQTFVNFPKIGSNSQPHAGKILHLSVQLLEFPGTTSDVVRLGKFSTVVQILDSKPRSTNRINLYANFSSRGKSWELLVVVPIYKLEKHFPLWASRCGSNSQNVPQLEKRFTSWVASSFQEWHSFRLRDGRWFF